MKPLFSLGLAALVLTPADALRTEYTADTSWTVEVEGEFSMETTDFRMERDGEPMEPRFGGGGTVESRHLVYVDSLLEVDGEGPVRLRREFQTLESDAIMSRGDEDFEREREAPLEGVTLELVRDGDGVSAEVVDGDSPDDEAVLEGHALALALDELLPEEAAEPGDEWELDGAQLAHALHLDVERAFFPPPERPEGGPRGRRGEERSQGRGRGGPGGRRGASLAALVKEGVWDASATLLAETEELDGRTCKVIAIEGGCLGSMEEPEREGPGGRRGGGRALMLPVAARPTTDFELELEGKLYFDVELRLPVRLSVEGTIQVESTRERSRGESTMTMYTAQEGGFSCSVQVTATEGEE